MTTTISVIIPVFNRPQKLARAVQSVLSQSRLEGARLEIIVVDDCSSPPVAIDGVRLLRLAENRGAAAARNAGIQECSGDYIAFLDSDDVWLPEKLAHQLEALKASKSQLAQSRLALVCGYYGASTFHEAVREYIPRPAHAASDFASGCWFCPGSTLLIHRSAFDEVGLLDERMRRLEDLDWFFRFGLSGGQVHVAPYTGAIIAPSRSAKFDQVDQSARLIEEKFRPGGNAPVGRREWRHLRAYLALERGAALLLANSTLRSLPHLIQSFTLKPRVRAALRENSQQGASSIPADVQRKYIEIVSS
jgi:glycosyltransferase involved in cell wall biosynthesis